MIPPIIVRIELGESFTRLLTGIAEMLAVSAAGAKAPEPQPAPPPVLSPAPEMPPAPAEPVVTKPVERALRPIVESAKWTVERIQLMVKLKSEGKTYAQMLEPLNALPGEAIRSPRAIEQKYFFLKSAGKLPAVKIEYSVARELLKRDAMMNEGAPMAWADIQMWARNNKISFEAGVSVQDQLEQINDMREHLGLPMFTLIAQRGPLEALPHPEFGGHDAELNAKKNESARRRRA